MIYTRSGFAESECGRGFDSRRLHDWPGAPRGAPGLLVCTAGVEAARISRSERRRAGLSRRAERVGGWVRPLTEETSEDARSAPQLTPAASTVAMNSNRRPGPRLRAAFRVGRCNRWRSGPGSRAGQHPLAEGSKRIVPRTSRRRSADCSVRRSSNSWTRLRRSSIHSIGGDWNTFFRLRRRASSSDRRASTLPSVSMRAVASAWLPRPSPMKSTKFVSRRSLEFSSDSFARMVSGRCSESFATSAPTRSITVLIHSACVSCSTRAPRMTFSGVFAPNSRWRREVTRYGREPTAYPDELSSSPASTRSTPSRVPPATGPCGSSPFSPTPPSSAPSSGT